MLLCMAVAAKSGEDMETTGKDYAEGGIMVVQSSVQISAELLWWRCKDGQVKLI